MKIARRRRLFLKIRSKLAEFGNNFNLGFFSLPPCQGGIYNIWGQVGRPYRPIGGTFNYYKARFRGILIILTFIY